MSKKLAFDTLNYAKMLTDGGVEHANVHSACLAEAIVQNIYVKGEVDKMIEETFKQFEARTREMVRRADADRVSFEKRCATDRTYHEKEALKLENRLERAINRSMYTTISVLGGLIVLVGAVVSFIHQFAH